MIVPATPQAPAPPALVRRHVAPRPLFATRLHRVPTAKRPRLLMGGPPPLVQLDPKPRPVKAPRVVRPRGRTWGADALGVSVPKRRRSLVLGGHGRNGAG